LSGLRIGLVILLYAVIPVAGYAAPFRIPLKPEAIQTAIKSKGAGAVLQSLFEGDKQWSKVIARIGGGETDWLKVAAVLEPASDGASAEDLRDAIFFALKPSPRMVLGLINGNKFADSCEPGLVDYSNRETRRMIEERIRIIEAISDTDLLAARDRCVMRMRKVLAEIRRHPKS
jgi:hypothetical protein